MPVIEHSAHCPYCDALISVFIELPEHSSGAVLNPIDDESYSNDDQQQDCQVCCRPIEVRVTNNASQTSDTLCIQLFSADDAY